MLKENTNADDYYAYNICVKKVSGDALNYSESLHEKSKLCGESTAQNYFNQERQVKEVKYHVHYSR